VRNRVKKEDVARSTWAMNQEQVETSGKVKAPEEEPVVAVQMVLKIISTRSRNGPWQDVDDRGFFIDTRHIRSDLKKLFGGKWRPSMFHPEIWVREAEEGQRA
jgi:hypothetical protein